MESSESKTLRNRNERILILLLSFVAAFRVLIFSAAFPFFSNVDEDLHFDLITQYSHGRPPRTFETVKEETLFWMVPYGSLEFLNTSDQFPGGKFPPPLWKQSGPKAESEFVAAKAEWSTETNFESSQPPLYYIVASLWWWIGKHIGFGDIQSLYWIRFLNVPLMAMVVWLGYTTARIFAPTRVDLRLVNRRVIESLIKAGAFDSLKLPRAHLLTLADGALESGQRQQRDRAEGQGSFFDLLPEAAPRPKSWAAACGTAGSAGSCTAPWNGRRRRRGSWPRSSKSRSS